MDEKTIPDLPGNLEAYLNKPFGGLFGEDSQVRILEEIVADPYTLYRPRDFIESTGASAPTIRKILNDLTDVGLLLKESSDKQRPVYRPNLKSKKLLALTLLSYASIDDRDGTECMDDAILDYYKKVISDKALSQAVGTSTTITYEAADNSAGDQPFSIGAPDAKGRPYTDGVA